MSLLMALQTRAAELGLGPLGVTAIADVAPLQQALRAWLDAGCHGDMAWMARDPQRRADPQQIIPQAQALISCTLNYYTLQNPSEAPTQGRIARYARGDDYHAVFLEKLKQLMQFLHDQVPDTESVAYVDTGPVLEKPWAVRAGLGFQGKNTCLIDPKRGSWNFVGEIITSVPLMVSLSNHVPILRQAQAERKVGCGTCTRCIEICPTRAITAPYQLDARKCISYLTIEHKGSIPLEMRPLMGNHIYGCDLCQDVCPWNRFATATPEPTLQPRAGNVNPELIPLMYMTDADFNARFKHSPIKRTKRRGFLRNVAVTLGNSKDPAAIPALQHALNDAEPLIREHAVWALAQIRGSD